MAVAEVFKLRPRTARLDVNWWLKPSPNEVETTNRLAEILKRNGARIARHDSDQLIGCFGSREEMKTGGLWSCDLKELPVRTIFKCYDMQGQVVVRARIEDDLGLQPILKLNRRRFTERYRQAFDRIAQLMVAELAAHNPEANRVVFWS